ncbi:GNAT family N-acetyltransferase [Cellulosilyticum lentocellum]|uniref:GCN5-related N-acetyltransferase n=1 Tax=Cellulosilyticum lentocellum (strain ATCC 49066 / DSM 5427 / NCIMB 11756 / RHM5) TaxID=642492 RepID=F2JIE3_CELLD|nr:GNAT family N-acetyltransferase [Cellulosilyticum lentocellum]ADZ84309.1 GCN5-related N-acetyltransferase [Cellulosilyticum lentocellum DSM 5427]
MAKKLNIVKLEKDKLDACVDLFIETFSKAPWNDVYESRNQVVTFFENHMDNNYFVGYVGIIDDEVVALSVGMKKPWINGMEYYIDEFCVSTKWQGQGIGSVFISLIEADIKAQGMNGMMLNTEKNYPSRTFYEKNGFSVIEDLIILVK